VKNLFFGKSLKLHIFKFVGDAAGRDLIYSTVITVHHARKDELKSVSYVLCGNYDLLLIQKTYQFINVVNGVSHSHKTANIFSFDSVA